MARYLSIYRRRTNLVDLNLQARVGAASYQFQAASNFDAAFNTFQVVPATGFRSVSTPDTGFDGEQFRGPQGAASPVGFTRFKFAPSDYTVAVPAVNDALPFYVRIIQTDVSGVVHPAESMELILPYNPEPNRPVILSGNAPNAASLAGSLEIQLPMQVLNSQFQNNGANDLFVAFEPTGAEFRVPPLSTLQTNLVTTYPSITQLFVRGAGGVTAFNFIGALRNNLAG